MGLVRLVLEVWIVCDVMLALWIPRLSERLRGGKKLSESQRLEENKMKCSTSPRGSIRLRESKRLEKIR